MKDSDRADKLRQWIKPSSDDEQSQQQRALRMVHQAIKASDLERVDYRIYAKGSYANQTNVRRDSDVDIAIDCHDCCYYESFPSVQPQVSKAAYQGPWSGTAWRESVADALKQKFGSDLDTSGAVAFHLDAVPGSRPSIDIVPGYDFRKYRNSLGTRWFEGSKVYGRGGSTLINWPQQQLENGGAKDRRTSRRYKQFVRALKSAENRLVEAGEIKDKPSFMMECLVYNVDDSTLSSGNLVSGFRATLQDLWSGLGDFDIYGEWLEPNERKWALKGDKKWNVDDAREVVRGAWNLLEFG